jgi:hypothetical protein
MTVSLSPKSSLVVLATMLLLALSTLDGCLAAKADPRPFPSPVGHYSQQSLHDMFPAPLTIHPDSPFLNIHRGGGLIPAGYHPLGYKISDLGSKFLEFDGSLDSDVGRFLASLKQRKSVATLKAQWMEILRVSKTGQSMRIYRKLKDLTDFCLQAGFLD